MTEADEIALSIFEKTRENIKTFQEARTVVNRFMTDDSEIWKDNVAESLWKIANRRY